MQPLERVVKEYCCNNNVIHVLIMYYSGYTMVKDAIATFLLPINNEQMCVIYTHQLRKHTLFVTHLFSFNLSVRVLITSSLVNS